LEFKNLPIGKKFILKPQKGFFGIGVKIIDETSDLKKIVEEIKMEIQNKTKYFSEDLVTNNDFLIEEYINGAEYAFDLFYNENGRPIVTNLCYHPMSKNTDYFHQLYYSNQEIYYKFYDQLLEIFINFNKTLKIKNLPIHAEFKEQNGKLIPIEFNVLRFGGFGLADLSYYGFGLEPYECYFENKNPDWNKIFQKHKNKYYGWVLCYNGIGIDIKKYEPNYERLKKDLGKILYFHVIDYTKNPVFAVAYVEKTSKLELEKILELDFLNYFILKENEE